MIELEDILKNCTEDNIHTQRVKRWIRSYKIESQEFTSEGFCNWFCISILPKVTYKSGRNYVMSLVVTAADQDFEMRLRHSSVNISHKQPKSAKSKSKSISWHDFEVFESALKSQDNNSGFISDWLRSTILTGLRPKEWCNCRLFNDLEGNLILKAKNTVKASQTPDGAEYKLPEYRVIPIGQYDTSDISCIRRHLDFIKITLIEQSYSAHYEKARKRLYQISKIKFLNKPPFNLYSGRHQFAANLKRSGLAPQTIALLMGHNDESTSRHSYGAKRDGSKGSIDSAVAEKTITLFQELFGDEGST
jgi:integrase